MFVSQLSMHAYDGYIYSVFAKDIKIGKFRADRFALSCYLREMFLNSCRWLNKNNIKKLPGDLFTHLVKLQGL